jgi:hypothetical protein
MRGAGGCRRSGADLTLKLPSSHSTTTPATTGTAAALAAGRRESPLNGARIVHVSGRARGLREFVRIANRTGHTLSFRHATLRNAHRGRARFPSRFRLRPGRTALVRLGCAHGRRRASFRGTHVWLCARRGLFHDRGDLARLADARGRLVSQRGLGRLARRPAY